MEKLTSINIKSIVAKINELISYTLDKSNGYDDSKLLGRIEALEGKPEYRYDDKAIIKMIKDIAKRQDDLARTQNMLDKEVKAIEIPKVPSVEPLKKRIKALEDKPQYIYDDRSLKDRVKSLESKPTLPAIEKYDDSGLVDRLSDVDKSIESLDRRLDFVRRTYSEKWEKSEFERVEFQRRVTEQINGVEASKEYDDESLLREIKSIKTELSDFKKSLNEILE